MRGEDAVVTWSELVKSEPGLAALRKRIAAVQDDGGSYFCANELWYGFGSNDGPEDHGEATARELQSKTFDDGATILAHELADIWIEPSKIPPRGSTPPSPGSGFKGELSDLVGWSARSRDPRIRTMEAYSLAYEKLYALLPACRNCSCL